MRRLVPLALVVMLAACGGNEKPERIPASLVSSLRILAVSADPPMVAPLQTSTLTAHAIHPDGEPLGYLWIACDPAFDPNPGGQTFSACQRSEILANPSSAQALLGDGIARPLSFDLTASSVSYVPPEDANGDPVDVLGILPPDDDRRIKGGAVTVLLVVGALDELSAALADPDNTDLTTLDVQVALKRVTIAEAVPNQNPIIEVLRFDDQSYVDGGQLTVPRGEEIQLAARATPDSAESFLYISPSGSRETRDETVVFSWYATAGRFPINRSQHDEDHAYLTPGGDTPGEEPADDRVTLWLIARDGRGGTTWNTFELLISP